jgi:glycerol-3-phosphate cytidylyltransferase-like family protein
MSCAYVGIAGDLLHHGHVNILNIAMGLKVDRVIIGLLTDEAIESYKRKPVLSYADRRFDLECLVDASRVEIVEQTTLDYRPNLRLYKPLYVVHGSDWRVGKQQATRQGVIDTLAEWGGSLVEPEYTAGVSTSDIINDLRKTTALMLCQHDDSDSTKSTATTTTTTTTTAPTFASSSTTVPATTTTTTTNTTSTTSRSDVDSKAALTMNRTHLDILSKNLDKCRAYWIRQYGIMLPQSATLAIRIPFDLFHAGVLRVLKRIMTENGFRSISLLLLPSREQLAAEWQRPVVMSLLSRIELYRHVNFIDRVETIDNDDGAKLCDITAHSQLLWITPYDVPASVRASFGVVDALGISFDDFVTVEKALISLVLRKPSTTQ